MKLSYILLYLLILSAIGFALMGVDKWKAKRSRYRISEKTLFAVALLGGAAGSTLGMHVFHHKTLHWYFKYGLPMLLVMQVTLLAVYACWDAFLR